jgi:hypothetical protein
MLGDPANLIDPDGRAGIPFLQDFMKSDGGTFLLNLAGQATFLGAMLSPLGSIGGTISNIVSIGASLYSTGSSVKNLAEFTSEGSTKTYARYDFSADFSMMKSSRHAGMAFEGAANESNGDPKKKDPKTVTIYSPSDNLKTNTAELEHKFLSSLYYQEPQGPSAWERYKQDEISIPQLISEWENSFDQTMMEFWQVGAYMLPSTGLSVAISGQDLLGNEVGVGMRVFSGVTAFGGLGLTKFALTTKSINCFGIRGGYGVFGKQGLNIGNYRLNMLYATPNAGKGTGTIFALEQLKEGGAIWRWDYGLIHKTQKIGLHSTVRFNLLGNTYGSTTQRFWYPSSFQAPFFMPISK